MFKKNELKNLIQAGAERSLLTRGSNAKQECTALQHALYELGFDSDAKTAPNIYSDIYNQRNLRFYAYDPCSSQSRKNRQIS